MFIEEISIRNFRLLSDAKMDFGNNLCLLIGRNNTGKTSFLMLFEKFLNELSFDFNDFSLKQRQNILNIDQKTDETKLAIQLILKIQYEDTDDLCKAYFCSILFLNMTPYSKLQRKLRLLRIQL